MIVMLYQASFSKISIDLRPYKETLEMPNLQMLDYKKHWDKLRMIILNFN